MPLDADRVGVAVPSESKVQSAAAISKPCASARPAQKDCGTTPIQSPVRCCRSSALSRSVRPAAAQSDARGTREDPGAICRPNAGSGKMRSRDRRAERRPAGARGGRSWHRRQFGQALGDVWTMQARESAVAWLDLLSQRSRSTRLRTRPNVSGVAGPRMPPAHRSIIRHWNADTHIGAADDLARLG